MNEARHPWGQHMPRRRSTWSRRPSPKPEPVEERPREVTALQRDGVPVPVMLAGHDPDRVARMRVGTFGLEYAK